MRRAMSGLVMLLAAVTLTSACTADDATEVDAGATGAADPATASSAGGAPSDGVPTSLVPPRDESAAPEGGSDDTPPRQEDPWAALARNDNRIESLIGSLCWLRWEVARSAMIAELGTPTDAYLDAVDSSVDVRQLTSTPLPERMAEALRSPAADQLAARRGGEPELDAFGAALVQLADALTREPSTPVDFEAMPGFSAYAQAAADAPECVRP